MIKECPIIINNSAITTFLYDGTKVQIPSINKDEKTIYVKKENGHYTVVDNEEETIVGESKKKVSKKSASKAKAVTDDVCTCKEVLDEKEELAENEVVL